MTITQFELFCRFKTTKSYIVYYLKIVSGALALDGGWNIKGWKQTRRQWWWAKVASAPPDRLLHLSCQSFYVKILLLFFISIQTWQDFFSKSSSKQYYNFIFNLLCIGLYVLHQRHDSVAYWSDVSLEKVRRIIFNFK